MREKLLQKKVACRICKGDHFTARCPFKDTLQPLDEAGNAANEADTGAGGMEDDGAEAGGRYIAPHMRKGAGARAGDSMGGGNKERDDLATLRVTNVSEMAEENDLRAMFERYGRVTRVFLAKDRETGRAKGFAFVSFQDRADAAKACEKMDGRKFPPNSMQAKQILTCSSQTVTAILSSVLNLPRDLSRMNDLKLWFQILEHPLCHCTIRTLRFIGRKGVGGLVFVLCFPVFLSLSPWVFT